MQKKNFRPNVGAVVLSSKYPNEKKIFLALRNDLKNVWQFPQGGIDENESPQEALFRELKEEIGTDEVEILCEYPEWISYEFPKKIKTKLYPFDGQIQRYFLVRLLDDSQINIDTKIPEFCDYKFVEYKHVFDDINHFKLAVYKKVLSFFELGGYF